MGEMILYAYLCDECLYIMECPCFVDKKCPKCGSELLSDLYLDTRNKEEKKSWIDQDIDITPLLEEDKK